MLTTAAAWACAVRNGPNGSAVPGVLPCSLTAAKAPATVISAKVGFAPGVLRFPPNKGTRMRFAQLLLRATEIERLNGPSCLLRGGHRTLPRAGRLGSGGGSSRCSAGCGKALREEAAHKSPHGLRQSSCKHYCRANSTPESVVCRSSPRNRWTVVSFGIRRPTRTTAVPNHQSRCVD